MTITGKVLINWQTQIETLNDGFRTPIKPINNLTFFPINQYSQCSRFGLSEYISNLNLNCVSTKCFKKTTSHKASGICCTAINFCRVFARKRTTTGRTCTPIIVGGVLATRDTTVPVSTAINESAQM